MKTPQEAAREYATKKCPYYVESDCDASGDSCNRHCQWFSVSDWTERANTFLAGAKEATRWISVEDELPDDDTLILTKDTDGHIDLIRGWQLKERIKPYAVQNFYTHWRPIERVKE